MRIISGKYRGRKLLTPKSSDIRPTSDKVRGAIFNTLFQYIDIQGAHVADLFCGTGALGLEALSRGAGSCIFIDKARLSLDLARQNAENLGVGDGAKFIQKDALKALDKLSEVDLIFADPPYDVGLGMKLLGNLSNANVLKTGAVLVIETEKSIHISPPQIFDMLQEKTYGKTRVWFLRVK